KPEIALCVQIAETRKPVLLVMCYHRIVVYVVIAIGERLVADVVFYHAGVGCEIISVGDAVLVDTCRRPAGWHLKWDIFAVESPGLLIIRQGALVVEEENDISFVVDVDIAFQSAELRLRPIYLHGVVLKIFKIDVAYLIVLAYHPKPVFFIQPDGQDDIVGKSVGAFGFMMPESKASAVVPLEATHGGYPDIAFGILLEAIYYIG